MTLFICENVINYKWRDGGDMKKEKIKVYQVNKSKNEGFESQKKYSIFLKRKRLENKMTLEELSNGICAISYLSRIENNIVEVDEEYFVKLFNKLNIDFYSLKETKENEIFTDLLRCYLLNNETKAIEMIDQALQTNFYVDLEYDLMVLYDNIIKELYKEARTQIIDLNNKIDILLDNELTFYLFLTALYTFRTNQFIFAYRQILVLCELPSLDLIYQYAIYSLALDIFESIGLNEMYFKYYQKLNDDNYLTLFPNMALKQRAQMQCLAYSLKTDETLNTLTELKFNLNDKYQEEIDWLIIKNEYRFLNFEQCLHYIRLQKPTAKIIALEAVLILRSDEHQLTKLQSRSKQVNYNEYDYHLRVIFELCVKIKSGFQHQEVYDALKQLFYYINDVVGDDFFFEIIKNVYMEFSIKFGKYKDCLKTLLDINYKNYKQPNFL